MIKVAVFLSLVALSLARPGNEAPPPQVHSYSVPQIANVAYPAPQVHRTVETYSAPSIEKTTTIVRTITSPLNAPSGQTVTYSNPTPVHHVAKAVAPVAHQVSPVQAHYANQGLTYSPQALSYSPVEYAQVQPAQVVQPAFAYSPAAYPAYNFGLAHDQLGAVYAAPSLGYTLGHVGAYSVQPAPVQVQQVQQVRAAKEGY